MTPSRIVPPVSKPPHSISFLLLITPDDWASRTERETQYLVIRREFVLLVRAASNDYEHCWTFVIAPKTHQTQTNYYSNILYILFLSDRMQKVIV